jgi:hypothetical protein
MSIRIESIQALANGLGVTTESVATQLNTGLSFLSTQVDQAKDKLASVSKALDVVTSHLSSVNSSATEMLKQGETSAVMSSLLGLNDQAKTALTSGYQYVSSLIAPSAPAPLTYTEQATQAVTSAYNYFTSFIVAPKPEPTTIELALDMFNTATNTAVEFITENSTSVAVGLGIGIGACALGYCAYRHFNNDNNLELVDNYLNMTQE